MLCFPRIDRVVSVTSERLLVIDTPASRVFDRVSLMIDASFWLKEATYEEKKQQYRSRTPSVPWWCAKKLTR